MSSLFDDRPVPTHVRIRIGVPLPRISFGAPGPLDGVGGFHYELSKEDRHIFEQAIKDANSGDLSQQLKSRWKRSLKASDTRMVCDRGARLASPRTQESTRRKTARR